MNKLAHASKENARILAIMTLAAVTALLASIGLMMNAGLGLGAQQQAWADEGTGTTSTTTGTAASVTTGTSTSTSVSISSKSKAYQQLVKLDQPATALLAKLGTAKSTYTSTSSCYSLGSNPDLAGVDRIRTYANIKVNTFVAEDGVEYLEPLEAR